MSNQLPANPFETVFESGDRDRLCAWAVSEGKTWVQTREPAIAQHLTRNKEFRLVATGVKGGYLKIFSTPYTLDWVRKNLLPQLTLKFPRKNALS
jgi:hypothetical protein